MTGIIVATVFITMLVIGMIKLFHYMFIKNGEE